MVILGTPCAETQLVLTQRWQCALPQLVTDDWERAVETLYLSLKQHNVCVLKVSEIMAKGN